MRIARILLVLLAIVATHFQISETKYVQQHDGKVCQTQECKDAAEYIKNSINSTVDPCDNFFEYACGGWMEKNPIPAGESRSSVRQINVNKNSEYVKNILEEGVSGIKGLSEKLMKIPKNLYKSCMNTEAIERVGDAPLKKVLAKIGGWPKPEDWDEDGWDFKEALQFIHRKFGSYLGPLFYVDLTADPPSSDTNTIELSQSLGKTISKEVWLENSTRVEGFKKYMIKVGKLLTGKDITKDAQDVINFFIKLAEIAVPRAKHNWQVTLTLKELKEQAPEYDWEGHLNVIFAPMKMEEEEVLVIPGLPFLKKVSKVIKETPKRVLANFLGWRLIQDETYYLPKAYRDARLEFDGNEDPWWETCLRRLDDLAGNIVGAAFVRKHIDGGAKDMAVKMFDRMRKALKENINSLPWMDKKTKAAVAEKVDAMKEDIGYPDYYMDDKKLARKFADYKNVVIRNNRFFQNRLNILEMIRKKMIKNLRFPVDNWTYAIKPHWSTYGYLLTINRIVLSAGLLQAPYFYGSRVPWALSYGGIGLMMGHEMTRGFDGNGRYYNTNGYILDTPRWTNKSIAEFKTKTKCLEDQYSGYKAGGKYPMNGKLTLESNIDDDGGLKAASKAYYEWLKENSNNLVKLPGIDFTDEQLLFIGLAQSFCEKRTPDNQLRSTKWSYDFSGDVRVNGVISNSHEFAKAFKCKKNSPMNPGKKCAVWSKDGPLDI